MRYTIRNTATATDETHRSISTVSDDRDRTNTDDTAEAPATARSIGVTLRTDFFESLPERVPPPLLNGDGESKTTTRERVSVERSRSAIPLPLLVRCCCYYWYVPVRYVRANRLTRTCQPGTRLIAGWSA